MFRDNSKCDQKRISGLVGKALGGSIFATSIDIVRVREHPESPLDDEDNPESSHHGGSYCFFVIREVEN